MYISPNHRREKGNKENMVSLTKMRGKKREKEREIMRKGEKEKKRINQLFI